MFQTVLDKFARQCAANANKTLFQRPGKPDMSFARAMAGVESFAAALVALGVKPGDRVAAQVDKSPEAVLLYLACLHRGAVFLPLNTAYTDTEIDYFLSDAEPTLFICRPESLDSQRARQTDRLSVASLGHAGQGTLPELAETSLPISAPIRRDAEDPAAILYTSGTTGRSKGAVLSHGNLASNCEALLEAWRFDADDRLIHALPIFHTHGLFVACNMALAAGATMIFLTRFDVDEVLDEMADATVLMGVPTFYTRLLSSPRLDTLATAGMRLFVSGSAPLLEEDFRAFEARTGFAILERYGMTETCMIASNPYAGERRPGAVGFPLPGVEVRITARQSGAEVARGEIGAIEVRGPNVFQGYWRMPDKTAAEYRADGFFVTGDLGRIDEDGYLQIVGRDKYLVITGGYNVYPKEIEALIDHLPGVSESAVIGLPHPDFGEAVTAIVVPRPGAAVDETALQSGLATALARYKQPKRVLCIDELPRNIMGKVQKAELRSRYKDLYRTAG